jgi:hypothetical protein
MIYMKKKYAILLLAILAMATLWVSAASAISEDSTSPGPKEGSGDGKPEGNQFIQPDTPGFGPAPQAGDGISDGSGLESPIGPKP